MYQNSQMCGILLLRALYIQAGTVSQQHRHSTDHDIAIVTHTQQLLAYGLAHIYVSVIMHM